MSSGTIFIVEDDVDTREMLARFLELEGFRVEMAANGQQALERLARGTSASVILLDLMMPVMDGWEFRRRQSQDARLRKIPTIVVSAAGRERITQIAADAYLSKPVDMDELLSRVTELCATTPPGNVRPRAAN
jgi:CheY-like chemotaxis protein